ncbi:MAG: hypothetical protein ACOX9C_11385 [Kiritimatiellia bacterium]|jgi:hypothetical protein
MKNQCASLRAGLLALALLSVPSALAADWNWLPASGKWEEPANWDAGSVPAGTATNFAYIANGGTCLIDDATPWLANQPGEFKGKLYVGGSGGSGTLALSVSNAPSRGLNSLHTLVVGDASFGSASLSGGGGAKVRTGNTLNIGQNAGGTGVVDVACGYLGGYVTRLGYNGGRGSLNLSGGVFDCDTGGTFGDKAGVATATLSGGTFRANHLRIYGDGPAPCRFDIQDASVVFNVRGDHALAVYALARNGILIGSSASSRVQLAAVPGTVIQFTRNCDADVDIRCAGATAAADLEGLNNITFEYSKNNRIADSSGDTPGNRLSQLEIGCADMRAKPAGFVGNFALDGLILRTPGAADATYTGTNTVQLVDRYANAGVQGSEVLYVKTVLLEERTVLDLNGKTLYYHEGAFAAGTVLNGTPVQVPRNDPTTLIAIR